MPKTKWTWPIITLHCSLSIVVYNVTWYFNNDLPFWSSKGVWTNMRCGKIFYNIFYTIYSKNIYNRIQINKIQLVGRAQVSYN